MRGRKSERERERERGREGGAISREEREAQREL